MKLYVKMQSPSPIEVDKKDKTPKNAMRRRVDGGMMRQECFSGGRGSESRSIIAGDSVDVQREIVTIISIDTRQ